MSLSRKTFHTKNIFFVNLIFFNPPTHQLHDFPFRRRSFNGTGMATEIFMTHYYAIKGWQRNIPPVRKRSPFFFYFLDESGIFFIVIKYMNVADLTDG